MVAFVSADAFFDREAGLHGVLYGAKAGEGRNGVHGKANLIKKVASGTA
jgi:hypothetical protein